MLPWEEKHSFAKSTDNANVVCQRSSRLFCSWEHIERVFHWASERIPLAATPLSTVRIEAASIEHQIEAAPCAQNHCSFVHARREQSYLPAASDHQILRSPVPPPTKLANTDL